MLYGPVANFLPLLRRANYNHTKTDGLCVIGFVFRVSRFGLKSNHLASKTTRNAKHETNQINRQDLFGCIKGYAAAFALILAGARLVIRTPNCSSTTTASPSAIRRPFA